MYGGKGYAEFPGDTSQVYGERRKTFRRKKILNLFLKLINSKNCYRL